MKSIFNGVISFGLISAPFKLFSATESHDISLNLVHQACESRINLKNFCPACNTIVERADLVKGHDHEGKFVVLSTEELKSLEEASDKTLEIVQFVDLSEIDPVYYEKSYYIGPDKGGEKTLSLLHQTLLETKKAALGKITLRSREHLILLRPSKNGITAHMLLYQDEVRENEELIPSIQFSEKEKALATTLVDNLTEPLDFSAFTDDYQANLKALLDAKVSGSQPKATKKVAKPKVDDLMDALTASIASTKKATKKNAKREKK